MDGIANKSRVSAMNIDFQQIHTFNAGGDIRHQDHFTIKRQNISHKPDALPINTGP
ncbi:hypothetical protein NIB75_02830 [Bacteroides uniformis]|nr:hypothetical protein [Bacteroides uniformis]